MSQKAQTVAPFCFLPSSARLSAVFQLQCHSAGSACSPSAAIFPCVCVCSTACWRCSVCVGCDESKVALFVRLLYRGKNYTQTMIVTITTHCVCEKRLLRCSASSDGAFFCAALGGSVCVFFCVCGRKRGWKTVWRGFFAGSCSGFNAGSSARPSARSRVASVCFSWLILRIMNNIKKQTSKQRVRMIVQFWFWRWYRQRQHRIWIKLVIQIRICTRIPFRFSRVRCKLSLHPLWNQKSQSPTRCLTTLLACSSVCLQ